MTADPFLRWDAAYVLGALSPSDRRAYEEHLPSCAACTAALAEVAGVPGMLARVEPAVALELDATSPPPAGLLDGLLERAEQVGSPQPDRATEPAPSAAPGAAPARPALAGAGAGRGRRGAARHRGHCRARHRRRLAQRLPARRPPPSTSRSTRSTRTPSAPTARLTAVDTGTTVLLTCSLAPEPYGSDWEYSLVVTDHDGESTTLGSWKLSPGEIAEWEATTEVPIEDIARLEIRDDMGQTLLHGEPAPGDHLEVRAVVAARARSSPSCAPGSGRAGDRAAAHLLELRARRHLLGEQRGLDAVEEPLEPADQLRLGDPQLGLAGHGIVGERQRDALQLLDQLGRQALLELLDRPAVDLLEPDPARLVERRGRGPPRAAA